MGLQMKEKQAITRETAPRYQRGTRKEKHHILEEFTKLTGYNRKYAIHLLSTWGKEQVRIIQGKTVRLVVGQPKQRTKRVGRRIYDERVAAVVKQIWETFDYLCGKRLAVLIRTNAEVWRQEEGFSIDEEIQAKLLSMSPATIDRRLQEERRKLKLKGRSYTRAGSLLKQQIPLRVFSDWDDQQPGFFELDTVAHDGGRGEGEFCWTLTMTDVASGWVELRALRNRAHRWVKEEVDRLASTLPFPLQGIDSDNGGEFINRQLWDWCNAHHITFTRSKPYRKNDSCYVEQKNDLAVRRTVGYDRFDTEEEYQALQEVYRHLCPLLNFYYPSMKLVEKVRIGSQVKKRYDAPQTPYLRLLESSQVENSVKENLRNQVAQMHLVKQKQLVDQAVERLLQLSRQKHQGHSLSNGREAVPKEEVHISTESTKKEKKKQKEKERTTTTKG